MRHRRIRVKRLDDLQHISLLDQPDPPAAKLRDGRGHEGLPEFVETLEGLLDLFQQASGRFAATAGFHAFPKEGVVPDLGSVVEYGRFVDRAGGFPYYLTRTVESLTGVPSSLAALPRAPW